MIEAIVESSYASAVGWALVAFAWQGTLVAIVTAGVLAALQKSDPRVRYAVACVAMLVMIALPVATTMNTLAESATPSGTASARGLSIDGAGIAVRGGMETVTASRIEIGETPAIGGIGWRTLDVERWLPVIAFVWFAGVLLLTARLAGGWMLVQRMRRLGRPVHGKIAAMVTHLAKRLGERRTVQVVESTLVQVPTAVGWLRPMILLPTSALFGLSLDQLEAILAHEIAHVRRRDYVVNILQTTAETILFYHPAVWWLSSRIRTEREHCADDLAIAACGDPVLYARALAGLEHMRPTPGLGVGATGGSLVSRVRRILGEPEKMNRSTLSWLAVPMLGAFVAVAAFQGSALPSAEGAEQGEPRPRLEFGEPNPAPAPEPEPRTPEPVQTEEAVEPAPTEPEPVRTGLFRQEPPAPPAPPAAPSPPSTTPVPAPQILSTPFGQVNTLWSSTHSGRMGIRVQDGENRGASVVDITGDGPADNAGIQEGDLIVEYNRTPVLGAQQLSRLVSETPLGRTVAVRYERNGQEQDVEVTVAETPAATALRSFNTDNFRYELNDVLNGVHVFDDYTDILVSSPFATNARRTLGLQIQELTPELRTFFGTPGTSGLLVASVEDGSLGGEAGILVGDVITAIDGNMVDSAGDIRSLANAVLGTGNAITVSVIRDGNNREIEVEPEDEE